MNSANTIRFGPDGNLYVADFSAGSNNGQVFRFNGTTGSFIGVFTSGYTMAHPSGMTFGPDGNLYVADEVNIVRFNGITGAFIDVFVPAGSDGLSVPPCGPGGTIAFGPDGNLYSVANGCSTIVRYNGTTGAFMDFFVPAGSGGLVSPGSLVFGPDGNLYVSDYGTNQVLRYNGVSGAFIDVFIPSGSGGLTVAGDVIFTPPTSCTLATTLSYSASTLTMQFDVGTSVPATWRAWLVSQSGISKLFAKALPVVAPPRLFTRTSAVPSEGMVGVVTTLSTPTAGIMCSAWQTVDTGGTGASAEYLLRLVEQSGLLPTRRR